ncbi:MAG: ACP phosphodiesterase [Gammaproteobacteria bacterium]|nr:ACP phosphodiesterase [Gammaproteobacteria bacterium]
MNFLAHCLIAESASENLEPGLIVGGFLGDFIKGGVPDELPTCLAMGVRLHRRIDAYSNQHPLIRMSCRRFPKEMRRLAPIFVDVLADHCLARHWSSFHNQPIERFTQRTYEFIASDVAWLPASAHRFFGYMRDEDLLAGYRTWTVVERALFSITRRLNREDLNERLTLAAHAELPGLSEDFLGYFPDMLEHARGWLNSERQKPRGDSD